MTAAATADVNADRGSLPLARLKCPPRARISTPGQAVEILIRQTSLRQVRHPLRVEVASWRVQSYGGTRLGPYGDSNLVMCAPMLSPTREPETFTESFAKCA